MHIINAAASPLQIHPAADGDGMGSLEHGDLDARCMPSRLLYIVSVSHSLPLALAIGSTWVCYYKEGSGKYISHWPGPRTCIAAAAIIISSAS